jgi:hypothetical protein
VHKTKCYTVAIHVCYQYYDTLADYPRVDDLWLTRNKDLMSTFVYWVSTFEQRRDRRAAVLNCRSFWLVEPIQN